MFPGLQTPRLKRLAEIVSAQAIAQQEKLEYGPDGNGDLAEADEEDEAPVATKRLSA
jgi:myosin-5